MPRANPTFAIAWDLLAAGALLALGIVAHVADLAPRLMLVAPAVLLTPGYLLLAALFPPSRRDEQDRWAMTQPVRLGLGLGLSPPIVALVGLAVRGLGMPITQSNVAIGLVALQGVCLIIAVARRIGRPSSNGQSGPLFGALRSADPLLTVPVLVLALVAAIAGGVLLLKSPPQEAFTEFYVLDPDGKAACYPVQYNGSAYLGPGDCGTAEEVIVGVANHEGTQVSYEIRIAWAAGSGGEDRVVIDSWAVTLPSVAAPDGNGYTAQYEQRFLLPDPAGLAGEHDLVFELVRSDEGSAVDRFLRLPIDLGGATP